MSYNIARGILLAAALAFLVLNVIAFIQAPLAMLAAFGALGGILVLLWAAFTWAEGE